LINCEQQTQVHVLTENPYSVLYEVNTKRNVQH